MRAVQADGGYILENSSGSTIKLSTEEALELAQIARLLQDRIRLQHYQTRFFPTFSVSVEDVILGLDAHHTQVILRLVQKGGLETSYAISLESSRLMRDGLTRKIEQMEADQQTRNTQ